MAKKFFHKVKETIFFNRRNRENKRSGENRRKKDNPEYKGSAYKRNGKDRRNDSDRRETKYNDFSQAKTIEIDDILSQLEDKLKLNVPPRVLQSATHCDQDYSCRKTDWEPSCGRIIKEIPGGFLEMDSNNYQRRPCKYHVYFGSGHLCSCPVHIEIFRRYGKHLSL